MFFEIFHVEVGALAFLELGMIGMGKTGTGITMHRDLGSEQKAKEKERKRFIQTCLTDRVAVDSPVKPATVLRISVL